MIEESDPHSRQPQFAEDAVFWNVNFKCSLSLFLIRSFQMQLQVEHFFCFAYNYYIQDNSKEKSNFMN